MKYDKTRHQIRHSSSLTPLPLGPGDQPEQKKHKTGHLNGLDCCAAGKTPCPHASCILAVRGEVVLDRDPAKALLG